MSMDSNTIALLGLFLTMLMAIVASFKYFTAELTSVREKIDLKATAIEEAERRARHQQDNNHTGVITSIQQEQLRLNDKFTQLALDAVRKSDMTSFETRIMAGIQASEVRTTNVLNKLESRIDAVLELERTRDK